MKVVLLSCQVSSLASCWMILIIVTKSVIALGSAYDFNKAAWYSPSETSDPCLSSAVSGGQRLVE